MHILSRENVLEHVAEDVPAGVFPFYLRTDPGTFILRVADKLSDDAVGIDRAIILYVKGVPRSTGEAISVQIAELVENTRLGKRRKVHIDCRYGVPMRAIKRLKKRYAALKKLP